MQLLEYNAYSTLFIIYFISGVKLWIMAQLMKKYTWAKNLSKICLIRSPSKLWDIIKNYRGKNYYLTVIEEETMDIEKNCLFTVWALCHFILYTFLGFFAPERFWETLLIGSLFEIFENLSADCHDALDLTWNSLGFMFGRYLHQIIR